MKQNLLIICLFFSLGVAFGQTKLQKADRHYKDLAFTQAAKEYAEYLATENEPGVRTLLNAANSNYYIGNMKSAVDLYKKAFNMQICTINETDYIHYLKALRGDEQYDKADELQLIFLNSSKGTDLSRQQFNFQKKYLDSISKLKPKFAVTNIASNSAMADFGTAFYGDKIVYASAKDASRDGAKKYSWNQQPYLTLYVADKDTVTGNFSNEKKFLSAAQTSYHNAAPAFSPNFKTVYATVNNVDKHRKLQNDKKGTNNVQLVYGQIKNEILVSKTIAAFNSPDYSVGQPAVSPDGKWLYFVSDMPGGYGETDIYRAQILGNNKLGDPINLGPVINTTGKEMFPFISNDVLYFASDGHYGLGGLDVFSSRIAKTTFAQPKNMGKPVNSNRDDFAFIINKAGTNGYLSSNRAGGKGDDDIYYISLAKDCNHTVNGTIVNQANKQPLASVTVKAVDSSGQVQANVITDSKGFYVITLPCDAKVIIEAATPDYTTEKTNVAATLEPHTTTINFELKPYASLVVNQGGVERIDINPIYFDFDKYNVREDAAAELDKVVYVLQKFPNVIINIESHTDSRGTDTYNMELSDNRAKSTYNYIISKGINPKQIESVNGYGETRLLNKCSNGVNCADEEHQLNRRSDFVIVIK